MTYLPGSHDSWLLEISHAMAMVKWAAANMYPECWCASLGVLWLLSLMVTLPLSQEDAPYSVPYNFLCFQRLHYFPGSQNRLRRETAPTGQSGDPEIRSAWPRTSRRTQSLLSSWLSLPMQRAGVMLPLRRNPGRWVGPGWHRLFWTLRPSVFQKGYEIYRH